MNPLQEKIIYLYNIVLIANCEHWYPANIERVELNIENNYLSINNITVELEKYNAELFEVNNPVSFLQDVINSKNSNTTSRNNNEVGTANRKLDPLEPLTTLQGINAQIIKSNLKPNKRVQIYNEHTKNFDTKLNGTKSRFLEVFQVVEFDHVSCTSGNGLEGICLPEYKCNDDGGSVMDACADGYGVCCVSLYSCEDSTSATTSWFVNPGFPSAANNALSCSLTLHKASNDIKQIRLDFLSFELLPPTAGVCQQDQFVISGQNVNSIVPIFCGINTGQHVYLEVSDVDGPLQLLIQTATLETRIFSIKVSQLTSIDDLAAPTGCLQYYKESEGVLESFNYRDTSEIGAARIPSYSNNLNYAMCIQRAAGTCSVTYTSAGDMQIVNYDTDGLPIIPPNQAGVEIYNCPSDYLLISATRLCGERLNDASVLQDFSIDAPVTDSSAGPIVIWFRSDEGYVGRGFKLKYQQNSCAV